LALLLVGVAGVLAGERSVRTVDALRALRPEQAAPVVWVGGYYRAGDGGGGRFVWDPSCAEVEDGGLFIASEHAGEGRWRRQVGRALSVKAFGARGDGATDDTPALQAALDGLAKTTASTLRFPRGTYRLATTSHLPYRTGNRVLLSLGELPLDGRAVHLSGSRARLFSEISPDSAVMLHVRTAFSRLVVSGLVFEKTALPLFDTTEAGADGIFLTPADLRDVENVRITRCTFVNCHRGVTAGLWLGNRWQGRLGLLRIDHSSFLYPYGANSLAGSGAISGGQMCYAGPWVHTGILEDNYFDGASWQVFDPATCPDGRVKDGAFIGSPLRLVFRRNTIRHFSVEGVFKEFGHILGYTLDSFVMPPADDQSTVEVSVNLPDSNYPNGAKLHLSGAGFFTVRGFDPETLVVSLTNPGGTRNAPPGAVIPQHLPVCSTDHPQFMSWIEANYIDGALAPGLEESIGRTGPGYPGIATHASRALIRNNRIVNCGQGIALYAEPLPSGLDESAESVVLGNVIETGPSLNGRGLSGIFSEIERPLIADNRIETAAQRRFRGIHLGGNGSIAVLNTVLARQPPLPEYDQVNWSMGVLAYSTAQDCSIHANRTGNLHVGVGNGLLSNWPYALGRVESQNDILPAQIDAYTRRLDPQEMRALEQAASAWREWSN
jgi:hypothetical protein